MFVRYINKIVAPECNSLVWQLSLNQNIYGQSQPNALINFTTNYYLTPSTVKIVTSRCTEEH